MIAQLPVDYETALLDLRLSGIALYDYGPRSPEEVAMLRGTAVADRGDVWAVPIPPGPGWWEVFFQDPLGHVWSAVVHTFEGADAAIRRVAATVGGAAGSAVGGAAESLFSGLDTAVPWLVLGAIGIGLALVVSRGIR